MRNWLFTITRRWFRPEPELREYQVAPRHRMLDAQRKMLRKIAARLKRS